MSTAPVCRPCPIAHRCSEPVPPLLRDGSDVLFVGSHGRKGDLAAKVPLAGGQASWLQSLTRKAGTNWRSLSLANVIPCSPPNEAFPTSRECPVDNGLGRIAIAHCTDAHLVPLLASRKWSKIVALGEEALQALTGRAGIWTWRGSPLQLRPELAERTGLSTAPLVMPTLHPDVLGKNMRMFDTIRRDLQKSLQVPRERYVLHANVATLRNLAPRRVVVDFEWFNVKDGRITDEITLCGISDDSERAYVCSGYDKLAMAEMQRIVENAEDVCAHNLFGAEEPWWKRLGWQPKGRLWDTMLGQALVQPDMRHALDYVVSYFYSAVHWKGRDEEKEDRESGAVRGGEQWRTWDAPDAIPREYGGYGGCKTAEEAFRLYNARDCAFNFAIWDPVFQVVEHYDMTALYRNEMTAVARIAYRMSEAGWKIDNAFLHDFQESKRAEVARLEQDLPEPLKPRPVTRNRQVPAPPGTYKFKTKKCRGLKKDGTAHDEIEWLFVKPGERPCPICGKPLVSGKMHEYKVLTEPYEDTETPWRSPAEILEYAKSKGVKMRLHPKTGNVTADKKARAIWARQHPEFRTINQITKIDKQLIAFAKPEWSDLPRLYYRCNPLGTASGRWSVSGGKRVDGLNLQQMPKALRYLFIPEDPAHGVFQADLAAAEPNITAFLANDVARLARLAQPGYSEHADLASRFFGFLVTKGDPETEDEYKLGKILNNGKSYGMGIKAVQYAAEVEGIYSDAGELRQFDNVWKQMNKGTVRWQQETEQRARADGYLTNPFGRRRWFQNSQSLATECLAFTPSSTIADIVNRCLIALHPDEFERELDLMGVEVRRPLPPGWTIKIQVHDAIVADGPHESHREAGQAILDVMTQGWRELNGFALGADAAYSRKSWGHCESESEWQEAA